MTLRLLCVTLARMGKKRKPPEVAPITPAEAPLRSADRHRDRKMIAVTTELYEQLRKLAKRNRRPVQWEAVMALEEHLRAAKLWPPPSTDADQ